ncbi:pilus assembly FimT family protein [Oscillatoria acuminata]|uniref:Prepilin-type N-terminal cleavage/methylation domain-containing protein n=1 Tax=Oscillatoria acuminata PCC 6304 TaxID=56110 RepID=K9TDB0_9CYAN|nr:prepilin-type N-terminal cleavage/methylation domain-containing protein [Oscillatoria acuminata]AFY80525.1 prepilin-type N-terminal cleavage/methylation domain-containing protein [Oscillatoria acuminata PCC 6304]
MKKQLRSRNPTTSGFTLLELLVVVFIIGILSAMGIPSWFSMINRQRVSTAQAQVVQALRSAQTTAKQTRSPQTVTFYPAEVIPTIEISGNKQKLGNGEIKEGMIQLEIPTGTESITFNGEGNVDADSLPFKVVVAGANDNPRRCVLVRTILGAMTQGADGEPVCNP